MSVIQVVYGLDTRTFIVATVVGFGILYIIVGLTRADQTPVDEGVNDIKKKAKDTVKQWKIHDGKEPTVATNQKIILVDAIHCFVIKGAGVFNDMFTLLESYPNKKIILTGANDEEIKIHGLDQMPYELFTLAHKPEKTDPQYYTTMLEHYSLQPNQVIYFENNIEAVLSAQSVGIMSYHYDRDTKDLEALKVFIDKNI